MGHVMSVQKKPALRSVKTMKRTGMAAAIVIVALLAIGVVSALTVNETQEKTIMIKGIGPDTAMTSDGQLVRTKFYTITNETDTGSVNETQEKTIMLKGIGPADTVMTSDGQIIRRITIKVDNDVDAGPGLKFQTTNWTRAHKYTIRVEPKLGETSKNDEVVMIGSIPNSSSLASMNNIPFQGPGPKIGSIHNSSLGEVSGSVAPGYAGLWGPFSWNAGDPVRVSAAWTPANQDVFIGIYDMAQALPYVDLKRGESGTYATTVPYTGSQWAYIIWNTPSNTATINYSLDN